MGLTYLVRLSFLSVVLVGMACEVGAGSGSVGEFQSTLPTASALHLAMEPASNASATGLAGRLHAPLEAPASGLHDVTVQAMDAVNLDIALLLAPLEQVTTALPVQEDADTAVWRSTNDAGSEENLLVIRRVSDGYYDSLLASRLTAPAGSPWRPRLAGSYTPGTQPGQGQGSMWIDLDTDLDPATSGTLLVLWSTLGGQREIEVFEYDLTTAEGDVAPRNGTSGFHENADLSGSFAFSGRIAILREDGEDLIEADALIVSRWTAQAEGRSDATSRAPPRSSRGSTRRLPPSAGRPTARSRRSTQSMGRRRITRRKARSTTRSSNPRAGSRTARSWNPPTPFCRRAPPSPRRRSFPRKPTEPATVHINAGMTRVSGALQADTLIANSVVGSSYTPGVGNVFQFPPRSRV